MLPNRHLLPIPLAALALATFASPAHAGSVQRVPACDRAAPAAQAKLAEHNKHCAQVTPPPPVEPPPPPPHPPAPTCDPALPSPLSVSEQAGPYTVTKTGATSLAVSKPDGGLSSATELDITVGGTGYGFTKGAMVPWFQLPWSDTEVRVENWEYFGTHPITSVQYYQYPYPGPLFGGWQQLDTPIVMGSPQPDCIMP